MKTKTKHTPGPWVWSNGRVEAKSEEEPGLIVCVADVYGFKGRWTEEGNGLLISASPDLLEAAKNSLAIFEFLGYGENPCSDLLRTAIAKAEGFE